MRVVRCPVLVGRDSEAEMLSRAVAGAASGHGSVVVVLGEAGVGKSRLTAAAAAMARSRGMTVLRGRAAASPTPVPYRPLAEALLSRLRASGPPDVPELAGFGPALSAIVPAWSSPRHHSRPESSVIVLGEAVLAVLRVVAGTSGAFVLLEDLHWADPGTLELLDYLVDKLDECAVTVVATVRAGEGSPAEKQARQFGARRQAEVIELDRLRADGVSAMVAASLGSGEVPADLVDSVRHASDGLPFLVEEVLAALVDSGTVARGDAGWEVRGRLEPAVPPSFAELVGERMASLPPSAAQVVRAAAVLGERFDWSLLGEVCRVDDDALAAALHAAADVQLVEEDRTTPGFRFRHALTRTAVIGALLLPERVAIADRALTALGHERFADPEHLELAAGLAETAGDRGRAAQLALASAAAALRVGAVTSALAAAQRALENASDAEHVLQAHELLLDAYVCAGDGRRVVEVGDQLLARLEAARAPAVRRGEAHLRLARAAAATTAWRRAVDHLATVEALVPDVPDELRAQIELLRAQVALGEHNVEEAGDRARVARGLIAPLGLDDLLCESLELLGRVSRVRDLVEAERHFTEALVIAEGAGLEVRRVRALHELGTIELIRLSEPARLRAARDGAVAIGAPGLAAQAGMHLAVALFLRYDLEESRAAAELALEQAERYRLGLLIPATMTVIGAIDGVSGRTSEAAAAFERARPMMDVELEATGRGHVLALAALAVEDRAGALREFSAAEAVMPPGSGVAQAPFRGLSALLRVVEGRSDDLLEELSLATASLHHATIALADVARAVVAGRAGDATDAQRRFSAGMDGLAAAPWYRHMAARLAAEAAIADGWGTPASWLRPALEFFEAAGLEEPARACRSLLRRAGVAVPRRGADGDLDPELMRLGITKREADVLALVAGGMSNKDVAARLYLSARTVEKHVERLMTKTGRANRAQLAAYASRLRAQRT
jgi:DNA-binding NarL/FixJ family response regulator